MALDQRSRSLIFNSDEIYDEATRELYFLGNDMIYDSWRDLKGSNFYKYMEIITENIVDINVHGFKMTIEKMEIEAD